MIKICESLSGGSDADGSDASCQESASPVENCKGTDIGRNILQMASSFLSYLNENLRNRLLLLHEFGCNVCSTDCHPLLITKLLRNAMGGLDLRAPISLLEV